MENKWKDLIAACKAYYIDCVPTGIPDAVYDAWEKEAWEKDGFDVRSYVLSTFLPPGTKTQNHDVDKISKTKVEGSMLEAIRQIGSGYYYNLKYDGTSLALYLDPSTGRPLRIITVGNTKIDDLGVDQTAKLINLIPKQFPKGIKTIQMEALVDVDSIPSQDIYKARQMANGLINSKYKADEISELLTIRAYRWWTDESKEGIDFANMDYREALRSLPTLSTNDGRVLFSPVDCWTLEELETLPAEYTETDKTKTLTGTFLNDGWVVYGADQKCKGALKFSGAGSDSEIPTTTVKSIQWNDQSSKGKDSWSANVIIEPVEIRGCMVRKPSAGSVSKLIKNNITPGAKIKVILANSTIPMVGDVVSPGDGNYMFPECSCGYKLGLEDIYGSNLKCGNPLCTSRIERMEKYLSTLSDIRDLDLNRFLVIDRFKWETTGVDITTFVEFVMGNEEKKAKDYLEGFLTTPLQQRNFNLVWPSAWKVLRESYEKSIGN